MNSKIVINGTIEIKTGMHIGTGGEFAAIGAIDSPVIKDQITQEPIIPGSTIKGKLRYVLVQSECPESPKPATDSETIKRMFGATNSSSNEKAYASRFAFSDCYLSNKKELDNLDVMPTEVKFENGINRLTGVATPRQIERVIRGAKFNFEATYTSDDESQIVDDFKLFAKGLHLLEYDYLGGGGSRGNGRVKFDNLSAEFVVGENEEIEKECNDALAGV